MKGEASATDDGFPSLVPTIIEPEALPNTTELPLTDKGETSEDPQQGKVTSLPVAQQRHFSVQWDPIQ